MGWLKKARRKISKTAKRSFTVKGLVNNAKNLSGVGLLQRSKTARKVALAGAAVVGAVYAAPYAASIGKSALAGAGKLGSAALAGGKALGGSLLQKLYAPPMNGPGPAEEPEPADLATQMYGAEADPMLQDQMENNRPLRTAAGFAGASAPASCASVGGSIDETGFYITVAAYSLIALFAVGRKLWGKYGRHAEVTVN